MPDTYLPAAARTIFGGPLEHAGTLGPCPFCGGDAEIGVEVQGGYFVQCTNAACGVSSALIFPLMDDVKPLLIERWNRRAAGDERRHMLLPEPAYKHIDGDTNDADLLWAEIHHLRVALQGPAGFATWQDAATDERIRRIKVGAALRDLLEIDDARIATGAFTPNAEAQRRIDAARAALTKALPLPEPQEVAPTSTRSTPPGSPDTGRHIPADGGTAK